MDLLIGLDKVEGRKRCPDCGEVKPLSAFPRRSRLKSGKVSYCPYCKLCQGKRGKADYAKHYGERMAKHAEYRQENREALRDKKRAWKDKWKAGRKCEACGEVRLPCLEFHHIDPAAKDATVSNMITQGVSDDLIAAEIAKCIVLCKNCHAWLHYQIGEMGAPTGEGWRDLMR